MIRPSPDAPHPGQHQLRHSHIAEHVGLELGPHRIERDGLDRPAHRVARVVDQRPDGAVLGLDGLRPLPRIDCSSSTSSASVRQPARSSSAIGSRRPRAVA